MWENRDVLVFHLVRISKQFSSVVIASDRENTIINFDFSTLKFSVFGSALFTHTFHKNILISAIDSCHE